MHTQLPPSGRPPHTQLQHTPLPPHTQLPPHTPLPPSTVALTPADLKSMLNRVAQTQIPRVQEFKRSLNSQTLQKHYLSSARPDDLGLLFSLLCEFVSHDPKIKAEIDPTRGDITYQQILDGHDDQILLSFTMGLADAVDEILSTPNPVFTEWHICLLDGDIISLLQIVEHADDDLKACEILHKHLSHLYRE
jgi:hypothetical protein